MNPVITTPTATATTATVATATTHLLLLSLYPCSTGLACSLWLGLALTFCCVCSQLVLQSARALLGGKMKTFQMLGMLLNFETVVAP